METPRSTRIAADGTKTGSDIRLTDTAGDSKNPVLVMAETEMGLAWEEYVDGDYEIHFALIGCP